VFLFIQLFLRYLNSCVYKFHPNTAHEVAEVEYTYSSTLSLTSTLDVCVCVVYVTLFFLPSEMIRNVLCTTLGMSHGLKKYRTLPLLVFYTRTA